MTKSVSERAIAIQEGERIQCKADRIIQNDACRDYRACKQKTKQVYWKKCITEIENVYKTRNAYMWSVLYKLISDNCKTNEPSDSAFLNYLRELSIPVNTEYFDSKQLDCAMELLRKYDGKSANAHDAIINDFLNTNFFWGRDWVCNKLSEE